MCIIIYRPAGKTIEKTLLENCADHNQDGWGIMYAIDGKLNVQRGLGDFKEFYEAYRACPKDTNLAIHFRYKTHGLIDLANCHPYSVLDETLDGQDLALMHNGTIHTLNTNPEKSDTWHYIEHSLRPVLASEPDLLFDAQIQKMIGEEIGWSKLLLMSSRGDCIIINQEEGNWKYGCWWSNEYSMKPVIRYYSNKSKSAKDYVWGDDYDADGYYVGGNPANYERFNSATGRAMTVGEENQAWEDDLDRRELEAAAGKATASTLSNDGEDLEDFLDDPDGMSETELYNWVCENPELATDYIMALGGGRL